MSTETTRQFHLGDLLSITDGRLVSPRHIDGVYDVVDYVTGQQHMTHQLPRAAEAIRPWLLRQHPWLADVVIPGTLDSQATVTAWLAEVTPALGECHEVRAMPLGMYVGREPISELREMAPHAQIIGVEVRGD
jgi:hypothetical protein